MAYQIYAGSTSQTVRFFIQDSSSTTGAGLTGLAYNTSGLTAYYVKAATGTATAITLATQTATGAYSSGGFCAVDGTNMPGVYRLDLPNAVVDTEAEVIVMLKGAANMAPVAIRITCAKLQVNTLTNADKTGYSLTQAFPANFASLGINSSGHVLRVVLVDTTTANTDMRGTDNALLAINYTAPDNATIGTINTNLGTVNTNVLSRLAATSYIAPLSGGETAAAVWNALLATYTTAGSFGARVVRSVNSDNELQLTGSHHAAAVLHDAETDSIPADALTAAAIAAIQAGLATSANQTTIIDRVTYGLTALVGVCSDAQTAAETYTLSIGGSTFTVDYSGLDSSGNRSTTTLSKV